MLWGKGKEMKKATQVIMPAVSPQEFEGRVLEIPRNSSTRSIVVVVDPNSHQIMETEILDRNISRRCSSTVEEEEEEKQEEAEAGIHKPDDQNV